MSEDKTFMFKVEAEWQEGDTVRCGTGPLPSIITTLPEELGGKKGLWTPEELFVASTVTCFMMTFLTVAKAMRIEFEEFRCEGEGEMKSNEDNKLSFTEIKIKVFLTVRSNAIQKRAEKAIRITSDYCPITRSINTNLKVEQFISVKK